MLVGLGTISRNFRGKAQADITSREKESTHHRTKQEPNFAMVEDDYTACDEDIDNIDTTSTMILLLPPVLIYFFLILDNYIKVRQSNQDHSDLCIARMHTTCKQ
jgi:hypothetical protein